MKSLSQRFYIRAVVILAVAGCNPKPSDPIINTGVISSAAPGTAVEAEANNTALSLDRQKQSIKDWQALRFGLFIHWGVYSIPAGIWQGQQIEKLGEQIQRHADISHKDYMAIARQFNPVNFNADAVVSLAKQAGMRYIVLTAKHHDGFAMFDSAVSDFDIVDFTPYKKDILKQLADATRKHGLKLGIYYSTPDWHFNGPNPERNPDDGKLSVFGKVSKANEDFQVAQLKELMSNYGDIVEVFFDMGEPTPEQSKRFRDAVKQLQPSTLINGRIMNNQGDFLTMPDNHVPDTPITEYPWETPGTFYHTWGYKSWVKGAPLAQQVRTQVRKLSSIASMGGNFLLNVGPKEDGSILAYEQQVLEGVGRWVEQYKEAIFDTGLNPFNRLSWGLASTGKQKLYLHIYHWPKDGKLVIPGLVNDVTKAYSLSDKGIGLPVIEQGTEKIVDITAMKQDVNLSIIALEYSGDLNIVPVHAKPDSEGRIELSGGDASKHGKYGRESYRSLLKDFYRSWYVDVPAAGVYSAEITYKMKYGSKDFEWKVAANSIPFTLIGNGKRKEKAALIDGNETHATVEVIGGGYRVANIPGLTFERSGLQQLILKQGQSFELKATTEAFKAQDHKYRTMNIEIEKIRLIPDKH